MKQYSGLTKKEVQESEKQYGTNRITPPKQSAFWEIYRKKYEDPIILVLLIALGINVLFTFLGKVEWQECAGILISVLVSTFVSARSEAGNENIFRKLQQEASIVICKVFRDGSLKEVAIDDLVKGDMVLLQSGDVVPTDGRLLDGKISVDQSPLTGESKEIKKCASKEKTGEIGELTEFWSETAVYRGSLVCSGEAVMRTDHIGDHTVYGRTMGETETVPKETPLTLRLTKLAKSISRFGYISAILLVILSFCQNAFLANHFQPLLISAYFADSALVISDFVSSVILGIIVIVVAVPEGLPLMIAIVCSLNMKKMLKSNVLVRKMVGIETAGEINLLFSDKTGTITSGKLEVTKILDGTGKEHKSITSFGNPLKQMLEISALANTTARHGDGKMIGGNGTEQALLRFIQPDLNCTEGLQTVLQVPFQSDRKYSAVQMSGRENLTLIKGAPELILPKCHEYLDENGAEKPLLRKIFLEKKITEYARKSGRILVMAISRHKLSENALPEEMSLLGIVVIRDEVRPEAIHAISEVKQAGIQIVMVTGDRKETAVAVAKESGLWDENNAVALTSEQLAKMTDEEIGEMLPRLCVVARALPTDKSRLVRIAQNKNLVVGMTGDGVNDAPALKQADVGFAMGSGSEVAKNAGDIVVLDDNFFSLRNAIFYGRTIFRNIKKFIRFQLTINVAAVAVSILGPIVGVEKPLDISQMIWANLMIDSLAAIAFGGEPALKKFMREKPQERGADILDREMWASIICGGLYISALSLVFFTAPWIRNWFRQGDGDIYFYTGYFTFFMFICIFNAFNARTEEIDLLKHLSLNKQFIIVMGGIACTQVLMTYFGGSILRTAGLTLKEWALVLLLAFSIIPVDMLRKMLMTRK